MVKFNTWYWNKDQGFKFVTPIKCKEGYYGWISNRSLQFIHDFMDPEDWNKQGYTYIEEEPEDFTSDQYFMQVMIRDLMGEI
jgi:hypothetical protein